MLQNLHHENHNMNNFYIPITISSRAPIVKSNFSSTAFDLTGENMRGGLKAFANIDYFK